MTNVALPALPGRLTTAQKLALAGEIVRAYARVRRELRRSPLPDVIAVLRETDGTVATEIHIRWLGQIVQRTLRVLPVDSRCLMTALVLTRLLARRGETATFVLGVSPGPGFAAHAWVEAAGRPLLPPGDDSFGRLLEL